MGSSEIDLINSIEEFSRNFSYSVDSHKLLNRGKYEWYSPRQVKHFWKNIVEKIESDNLPELLNFYIHVPFCMKKCDFCNYYSVKCGNENRLCEYVDYLKDELEYFKDVFKEVEFRNFYIGGGTPNILGCEQLKKILTIVRDNYKLSSRGQRAIELHPAKISENKLRILKEFGINFISLGVQTLSEMPIELSNRAAQSRQDIFKYIEIIKELEFERGLNVDLLFGLKGETRESFMESFRIIAGFEPESIAVNIMIPGKHYVEKYFGSDFEKFNIQHVQDLKNIAIDIVPVAESFGYNHTELSTRYMTWNFSKKKLDKSIMHYNNYTDIPILPFSVFALGPSSRSHIYSKLSYSTMKEVKEKFDPDEVVFRGKNIDMHYEMIKFILLCLKKNSLCNFKDFHDCFGTGLKKIFSCQLKMLKKMDEIRIDDNCIEILNDSKKALFSASVCFLLSAGEHLAGG